MSVPLWRLDGATLSGRVAIAGVLELEDGVTAVLGGSGAGKSSLLELLVGHAVPNAGRVAFQGAVSGEPAAPRLRLYWAPQGHGLWPALSVRRHLELVAPRVGATRPVAEWLLELELDHVADQPPERLSAGERGRLAAARALASEASVLVLDEPFSGTDARRSERCWAALREHQARTACAVVFATHDPGPVVGWAGRVLALEAGSVAWSGATSELYGHASTERLAWLLGPVTWWPAAERHGWLDPVGPDHPGLRPERIGVEPAPTSEVEVTWCRFAGAVAELELVRRDTLARRRVYARPPGPLAPGTRVRLGWRA